MESIIRAIDLETGEQPSEEDPGIIEYAHVDLVTDQHDMLGVPFGWEVCHSDMVRTFVKPHAPIPPDSSAINNIIDEDVADAPEWGEIAPWVTFVDKPAKIIALAAHNIECEKTLIGKAAGDLPWIDTYKIALRLWPESPSHSNNAIRYFLRPQGLRRELALPTHRALPDAYVTAFTLREALTAGHSVETLIKWSSEPGILPRCKLGKFRNNGKGTPWAEVDSGFLRWILEKDFDLDTMHTARFHLDKREMDQREEQELADLNRQYRANGMPETTSFSSVTGQRYGINASGKPADDFAQTDAAGRDHPSGNNTLELPL